MANASLIDLFREEALGHVQALAGGLVELEREPADARRIEPLMRAAHSVKGAARAVDVDPAVKLAHELEECLVRAQKGQLRLGGGDFDLLLNGAELLRQIVTAAGPGLPEWTALSGDQVQAMIDQLQALARGERSEPPPGPASGEPAPQAAPSPAPAVDWSAGGQETAEPLLALFRQEVQQTVQALREALDRAGETDPAKLITDVHALRGAARLVKSAAAIHLAGLVEDRLLSCQQAGQGVADADRPDVLEACDWLVRLAEAAGPDYPDWLAGHAAELQQAWERLHERQPIPRAAPALPAPLVSRPEVAAARTVTVPVAETPPAVPAAEQERVVRVTAQSLTRLMGLAGESLVEARWLQPFAEALLTLKRQQARLGDEMDELTQELAARPGEDRARALTAAARQRLGRCVAVLADRIAEFENHARTADDLNSRLYREVIASRMRPFRDGVQGYPLLVRNLARELGKAARLDVVGETTEVDRDILEKLDAPLTHLLRNSIDHGLEPPAERQAAGKPEAGRIVLEARHNAGMLSIQVSDDGRGIDLGRLRRKVVERQLTSAELAGRMGEAELLEFLFLPGFTTRDEVTEVSGRGVGLDVVYSMIHGVGGTVRVHTELGRGTRFHLQLPVTLSVIRAVLVRIAGEPYAFPLNRIDRLVRLAPEELHSLEDRQYFRLDGRNVGVVLARQVLELEPLSGPPWAADHNRRDAAPVIDVVVFSSYNEQYGLLVDDFLGEHDLVVRPLDPRLGKVPDVNAAAIADDGTPVLILDLDDLRRSVDKLLTGGRLRRADRGSAARLEGAERAKRVLVVDDSITVRETERQLLQLAGYEVEVAVDGVEGWTTLREGQFDLVISDVDMPRMNGLDLVRHIKGDPKFRSTPVIIVSYKDREEDRWKGLDAGANYYLTKSSFQDDTFIRAVQELIGGRGE